MKLAMLADVPGWCFDRTGRAMMRFDESPHSWDLFHARDSDVPVADYNPWRPLEIRSYDGVRIGGFPLFRWFRARNAFRDEPRTFPTIASFWDIDEHLAGTAEHRHMIAAVIINDRRMEEAAKEVGRPIIYSPDRVDHHIFRPLPRLRPTKGPLRVGWAGSVKHWPGLKHPDLIREAAARLGMTFVRQDREADGQKTAAQMAEWFNTLDLYVSANEERTCTPVVQLEAAACGITALSTRCGELWPAIEAESGGQMIIEAPTEADISTCLGHASKLGRDGLQEFGARFLHRHGRELLTWQCGEATRVTEAMAALLK